MNVTIAPAPLEGTLPAVSSKSDAHRLLICAALADRPTVLALPALSEDIEATIRCLRALGAGIVRSGETVTVSPIERVPDAPLLPCGESGSTLRFLLPVAAALTEGARFTGRGRLPDRPVGALRAAMEAHGVTFSAEKLPFALSGRLQGGSYALPGDVSSQYLTGLLLALPHVPDDSTLTLTTKLESAAYVDMTLSALRRFGGSVSDGGGVYALPGGQRFHSPGAAAVDGDWSSAAFFLTAGAIGREVTVTGLDADSPQGDKAVLDILRRFGAETETRGNAVTVRPAPLRGCEIDVSGIPDLLPVLSVAAACASGETRFTNAARLRLKESDRLAAVSAMLRSLGGSVTELPDGLTVRGGALTGGTVDGFRDHRIVMSAAIAAIRCSGPVTITGAGAAAKSYPAFFDDYTLLGGNCDVL
jgi:3-phosphoshikimate 1-carboxyvinyltransferase